MSDATKDCCGTFAFEQVFVEDNRAFVAELDDVRHAGVPRLPRDRGRPQLALVAEVAGRARAAVHPRSASTTREPAGAPVTASRRRASRSATAPCRPRFGVYGYYVRVERDAREFLDLSDVRADGPDGPRLRARARSRPRRSTRPGAVTWSPARGPATGSPPPATTGACALDVDLGPPHEHEQFTPEQQEAEKRGSYWVTRRVAIEALPTPAAGCADTRAPVAAVEPHPLHARGASRVGGRASDRGCAGVGAVLVAAGAQDRQALPVRRARDGEARPAPPVRERPGAARDGHRGLGAAHRRAACRAAATACGCRRSTRPGNEGRRAARRKRHA